MARDDEIFMLLGDLPPTGNLLANDDLNSSPLTLVVASYTVGEIAMSTESVDIPVGPLGALTVDRSGSYTFTPSGITGNASIPYVLEGCVVPAPAASINISIQELA